MRIGAVSRVDDRGRTGRGRLLLLDLLLAGTFLAVVAAAAATGAAGRRTLAVPIVRRCESAEQLLPAWRSAGVHGRVLVHFARDNGMSPDAGPLSPANQLYRAVQEGVIRRIYHVIPDHAWAEVEATLRGRDVAYAGGAFRLDVAGAPLLVLDRTRLPALREPALVTIDTDAWSQVALSSIRGRIRSGDLESDLVLWHGAPQAARTMEGPARASP
jgi:hypothetical protein